MKIISRIIFSLIGYFSIININANNVLDLKGQKGIFAPQTSYSQETVYTLESLKKYKFEDKYLYNKRVEGDTIIITDVLHIFPDKKKKEAILILFNHAGNDLVYYIPLHYEVDDKRSFRNFIVGDKHPRKFGGEINWNIKECSIDDIDVVFYKIDDINYLRDYFQGKEVWPTLRKGSNDQWIQLKDSPFIFKGLEFCEGGINGRLEYPRNYNIKTLHAFFKKANGDVRSYELIHQPKLLHITYIGEDETTPSSLTKDFITLEECKYQCEESTLNHKEIIDSINNKYRNKLIHLNYDKMPDSYKRKSYCVDENKMMWPKWDNEYFNYKGIECLPILDKRPYHSIYAVITDSNNKEFVIPVTNSFFDYVEDGLAYKEKVTFEMAKIQEEKENREAQKIEEEQEYLNNLTKKYGRQNAKLIINGEIKLGFNKAMVIEAWGNPYDTMTVTNSLGTVECWIYGIGSYIYFQGEKVVQIID